MIPIQAAFILFCGAIIARIFAAARANRMSWRRAFFWIGLWSAGLGAVLFPELTGYLARAIGVTRGADAVLYLSVAMLSFLVFRLYSALERQDHVITHLVSELALRDSRLEGGEMSPRG